MKYYTHSYFIFWGLTLLFSVLHAAGEDSKKSSANYSRDTQSPPGMVWIPSGVFMMGDDTGNKVMPHGGHNNEGPVHEVKLDGFWIDMYPVTNEQFAKFVEETDYSTYSEQKPKAEDWPGALPEMLIPASIVF